MASKSNDQSFLRGDLNEEGWEHAGSSKIGSYQGEVGYDIHTYDRIYRIAVV